MAQGRAEQPEEPSGEKAQASAPTSSPDRLITVCRFLKRKVINFAIDWVALAIVLFIFSVVLMYAEPHSEALIGFQKRLQTATSNLNPAALLDYVFEWGEYIFAPVRGVVDGFFGAIGGLIDWILSSISHLVSPLVLQFLRLILVLIAFPVVLIVLLIMLLAFAVYFFFAALLSPITLTLTILIKGTVLEAVLLLLVFLPLVGVVFRVVSGTASDLNVKERAGLLFLGTITALVITTLFYFFVQMAMMGAAWAVGLLIPQAPAAGAASVSNAVGLSAVSNLCIHCTVKTVDDSVTEALTNPLKKVFKKVLRLD